MELYIQIGLGILVLASFVIAYFSARTWHWGHVLTALGVFLSTLLFFVLAMEVLRINAVLRSQANQLEEQIDTKLAQNEALRLGTDDATIINEVRNLDPPAIVPEEAERMPSLAELDHEILIETRRRGRVWRNVAPAGVDPKTGTVQATIPAPTPSGLQPDTVVFLFEMGPARAAAPNGMPQGPQFLGEFRVAKSEGQQAVLTPVWPLTPNDFELKRLGASQGPWVIYETMPMDRHEAFAGLDAKELRQMLPADVVGEYVRDNAALQKAAEDEESKLKPTRELRDYASIFDSLWQRRMLMLAQAAALQQDISQLTAALEDGKKLQAFREDEIARRKKDLAGLQQERQAIERHLALIEKQIARARELIAQTMKRNDALVEELAATQLGPGRRDGGAQSPADGSGPLALDLAN